MSKKKQPQQSISNPEPQDPRAFQFLLGRNPKGEKELAVFQHSNGFYLHLDEADLIKLIALLRDSGLLKSACPKC